jgi:hypothetical protein
MSLFSLFFIFRLTMESYNRVKHLADFIPCITCIFCIDSSGVDVEQPTILLWLFAVVNCRHPGNGSRTTTDYSFCWSSHMKASSFVHYISKWANFHPARRWNLHCVATPH